MKQLQLLFITLFIANLLPAQELQWYKIPDTNQQARKKPQEKVKDFLYEDEGNIYFSVPRGEGQLHYREQVYVGYVKMDKSTFETELIAPSGKEVNNGVSLLFPFNGQFYSIEKKRGKKNEPTKLSYYTEDNPPVFIKNIGSYGKNDSKNGTCNGSIADNRSTLATNSISYSPDGNQVLITQYYFSTNTIDFTILDKEMNLVLDDEISLLDVGVEFKDPVVNDLNLDNDGNITILWDARIDVDKILKQKSDIISYYDRNKGKVQHKIFPLKKKDVQSIKYEFKNGELNIVAVVGKVKHSMNPIPGNSTAGIRKKSLLIGGYDRMNNEWDYHINDTIIQLLFDSLDVEEEDPGLFDPINGKGYQCSVYKFASKGNTLGVSLSFEGKNDMMTFNTLVFLDKLSKEVITSYNFKKENWRHHRSYPPINKIYLGIQGDNFVSIFPSLNKEKKKIFHITTILDSQGEIISQTEHVRTAPEVFITNVFHLSSNDMYIETARVIRKVEPPSPSIPIISGVFGPMTIAFGYSSKGRTIYKKRKTQLCKIVF